MATKRLLKKELEHALAHIEKMLKETDYIRRENNDLRRANRALGEEVNRLNDTIDQAIAIIEERQKARKRMPAWLREVIRDGK